MKAVEFIYRNSVVYAADNEFASKVTSPSNFRAELSNIQFTRMKILVALFLSALSCQLTAQNRPREASNSEIEKTVIAALSFQQSDRASFEKAHENFTPKGWDEFIKTMQGFLDSNGAPTFKSRFVPAGPAVIFREENGNISAKIPGTLTQTHDTSTATYRMRVEVQTVGTSPKIDHLKQITCLGAAAAKFCM